MDPITLLALLAALFATGTAAVLYSKLSRVEHELGRAKRRMERLDELADNMATREFKARTDLKDELPEPAATSTEILRRKHTPVPLFELEEVPQTGKFSNAGLEFDSAAVIDDDDFAAPRLAAQVADEKPRKQKPSRERHETPVGSPRNLTPVQPLSVVEVGKIQVRSENVTNER